MRHLRILYIHGHGSMGNSRTADAMQRFLGGQALVYHPLFSNEIHRFEAMQANIQLAGYHVEVEGIDLVVGSSLGGFVAHALSGIPKIFINPCLEPSQQIPLLIDAQISQEEIQKYMEFEKSIKVDAADRGVTAGVFGKHDELFSFKSLYEKLYGEERSFWIEDSHRISVQNVKDSIIPLILQLV